MNKRIVFIILIFLALVFGYWITTENAPDLLDKNNPTNKALSLHLPSPGKISPKPQVEVTNQQPKASEIKSKEEADFEAFDKMERDWLIIVEKIIPKEKMQIYHELRTRCEKEKMQAYKEYHDYLRLKYGDKFKYNLSEDHSEAEKKINERYQKSLLELLGKKTYQDYLSAKDQYNINLARQGKMVIEIEI